MINAVKTDDIEEIERVIAALYAKADELSIVRDELIKKKNQRHLSLVK